MDQLHAAACHLGRGIRSRELVGCVTHFDQEVSVSEQAIDLIC
jgi:hypothetical protein